MRRTPILKEIVGHFFTTWIECQLLRVFIMKFVVCGCMTGLVLALAACSSGGSSSGGDSSSSSGGSSASGSSASSSSSSSNSSSGALAASHRAGQNCLESGCHSVGDAGGSEFYVGGTVYRSNGSPQTNATIRLYVHNTNTLVKTLQTDGSGNFYTTDVISELHIPGGPAVVGVDAVLEGPSGGMRTMPGVVSDAHCNVCHIAGVNGRLIAD